MRSIFTNNDLLRHEQQQRPPILRQILNRYIFAIMTLLRQTRERSSRDSICDAITLTSDEYETLYAEVKREIRERAILSCCKVRRLTVAYRRKMRCNYNSETRLRNNDRYAKAVVYSAGQSNTVNNAPQLSTILTLEREVGFEDKRSGIYYYTKTADS
ncbi:hypothetical protein HBI88_249240 [Parastagonospora nodorum]|nr:hypothetical protein HBI97_251770 [Parastagonospora nodorum]KAH5844040.1 hypothetical protein HBI91_252660 [Parastagonospora nodorum]KAH5892382.1 hypothetical protein HBI88_249240 [Parastagonospora nodorum]KAH5921042.1 hypothetical protein HBI86_249140 [Parastagonospora nodorum]